MGSLPPAPMALPNTDVDRKHGFGVLLVCNNCHDKETAYCKVEMKALPKMGVNRVRCLVGYDATWQRIE